MWFLMVVFLIAGSPSSEHGVMIEGFKSQEACLEFAKATVTAAVLESGQTVEANCVKGKSEDKSKLKI